MAYAYPSQWRTIVSASPPEFVVEPGAILLSSPLAGPPPPPPPPPPPVTYFAGPFFGAAAVQRPSLQGPVLVPVSHAPIIVPPPPAFRVDPAALIRMDEQRTKQLIQFMEKEGLMPSAEEEMKRRDAIQQLNKVVLAWIRKVAGLRKLPKEMIATASARIWPYGSYGLGVHGSDSDIDALCVGPYFANMEEDFFSVLRNMLQNRPEVSEIHCVKSAKVPLMRFKFNGIPIDFPYVQLQVTSVPDHVDLFNPCLMIADETSWRSLSGVRVNARIIQLVPNLKNFQSMLRCVKLWARKRGVYSHLLAFYGGIHLAILAAHVCQRCPNASVSILISIFFETFANWHWPKPVVLLDKSTPFKHPDGRSLMPIMMPCSPSEWCNSNITRSTFNKIKTEFQRGYSLTRDLGRPDFDWSYVFEPFPYAKIYACFVRIFLAAPDGNELRDWVGWVKSRFRGLLLKLESVHGFCDPNPTEYVDHNVAEPNVVFYWGLSSIRGTFANINSIKEDFMKSISNDELFGDHKSSQRKLELSIVQSSQLPKSMLESGGTKGSKACWRILDYSQLRKPIYSQFLPNYVVGYVATNRDYESDIG